MLEFNQSGNYGMEKVSDDLGLHGFSGHINTKHITNNA